MHCVECKQILAEWSQFQSAAEKVRDRLGPVQQANLRRWLVSQVFHWINASFNTHRWCKGRVTNT